MVVGGHCRVGHELFQRLGDKQSKMVSRKRLDGAMGSVAVGGWVRSLTHRAYAALFVEAVGLVGAQSMQPEAD